MIIDNTPGFAGALKGFKDQQDEIERRRLARIAAQDEIAQRRAQAQHAQSRFGVEDAQADERFAQQQALGAQNLARGAQQLEQQGTEFKQQQADRAAESAFAGSSAPGAEAVPKGMEGEYAALLERIKDPNVGPEAKGRMLIKFHQDAQRGVLKQRAGDLQKQIDRYLQLGGATGGFTAALQRGPTSSTSMSKEELAATQKFQELRDTLGKIDQTDNPVEAGKLMDSAQEQFREYQRADQERSLFVQSLTDARTKVEELRGSFAKNQTKTTRLNQIATGMDHGLIDPKDAQKELNAMETGADEDLWGKGRHVTQMPDPVRVHFFEEASKASAGAAQDDINARNAFRKAKFPPEAPVSIEEQQQIRQDHMARKARQIAAIHGWDMSPGLPQGNTNQQPQQTEAQPLGPGEQPQSGQGQEQVQTPEQLHQGVLQSLDLIKGQPFDAREQSLDAIQQGYVVPRYQKALAMPPGPEREKALADLKDISTRILEMKGRHPGELLGDAASRDTTSGIKPESRMEMLKRRFGLKPDQSPPID